MQVYALYIHQFNLKYQLNRSIELKIENLKTERTDRKLRENGICFICAANAHVL